MLPAGGVCRKSHRWDVFPDLLRLMSALSAFNFLGRSLRTRCVLIVAPCFYLQGQNVVITHVIAVSSLKRQSKCCFFPSRCAGKTAEKANLFYVSAVSGFRFAMSQPEQPSERL